MIEEITVARPYAVALYRQASTSGNIEKQSENLHYLTQIVENEDVSKMVANPSIGHQAIESFFVDLCKEQLDDSGLNFLKLLLNEGRINVVSAITALYDDLMAESKQILNVTIVSAQALSDADVLALTSSLKSHYEREIEVETDVDKTLIGGAIIYAGDQVIDGSVKGRLEKLGRQLTN